MPLHTCTFVCTYSRGRFALETLAVWAVLCLPINLLTCYMVTVAPDYDHLAQHGEEEGGAPAGGNLTEEEGRSRTPS